MQESIILLKKFESFNENDWMDELMLYDIKDYIYENIKKELKNKDKELKKTFIKSLLTQITDLFKFNNTNDNVNHLKKSAVIFIVEHVLSLIINKKNKDILIEIFNDNPIILKDIIEKTLSYESHSPNQNYKVDECYKSFDKQYLLKLIKKVTANLEIKCDKNINNESLIKILLESPDGYLIFEKLNEESKSHIQKVSSKYKFCLEKENFSILKTIKKYSINFVISIFMLFLSPIYIMGIVDSRLTKKMSKYEIKGVDYAKCLLLKNIEIKDLKHLIRFKFENPTTFNKDGVLVDLDLFEINFKI